MKDNFFIRIETIHLADRGTTENVRRRDLWHVGDVHMRVHRLTSCRRIS
jgi:hypothetical protein